MNKDFRALLVFPPSLLAETAPISTATLTSYIRHRGVRADQADWNATFNRYLLDRIEIERVGVGDPLDENTREFFGRFFLNHITGSYFQNTDFRSWKMSQRCAPTTESLSMWDPPFPFSYCEFLPLLTKSGRHVYDFVRDPRSNLYHRFFDGEIKAAFHPDTGLVGFSIMGYTQVIPSLTLGLLLKRQNPDLHICWGGPWVTSFAEPFMKCLDSNPELSELIDTLVVREGEEPFRLLAEALAQGKQPVGIPAKDESTALVQLGPARPQSPSQLRARMKVPSGGIPNMHWRDSMGRFKRSGDTTWVADMSSLPTPDYTDFNLNDYITFKEGCGSLVLQGSRSCYYMKCSFCNAITNFAPYTYRERSTADISKDITEFLARYPRVVMFDFADAVFPAKRLVEIARFLISLGRPELSWEVDVRFENNISLEVLKLMKESNGTLRFGLETVNDRLLDLLEKGNLMDVVRRLLGDSRQIGYKPFLMTIAGLPTEERFETEQLYDFLCEYRDTITYQISDFIVERNSPIHLDPERFGIRIDDEERDTFNHHIRFERLRGYSNEEAGEVFKSILIRTMQEFSGARKMDLEAERRTISPKDSVYRMALRIGDLQLTDYCVKWNNRAFSGLVPIRYKVRQENTWMEDEGTLFEIDPVILEGELIAS